MESAPSKDQEKVMGDRRFGSRHPALKYLAVTVSGLVVGF